MQVAATCEPRCASSAAAKEPGGPPPSVARTKATYIQDMRAGSAACLEYLLVEGVVQNQLAVVGRAAVGGQREGSQLDHWARRKIGKKRKNEDGQTGASNPPEVPTHRGLQIRMAVAEEDRSRSPAAMDASSEAPAAWDGKPASSRRRPVSRRILFVHGLDSRCPARELAFEFER